MRRGHHPGSAGQRDAAVEEVKQFLFSNDNFPTTSLSPIPRCGRKWWTTLTNIWRCFLKPSTASAGLEGKEPVLDGMTYYLAMNLQNLSYQLRNDIEVAYKYAMVQNDTQGTILRDGTADHIYYFAQTDPDWADEIFEFEGNGATLRDRGCGTACAAMVFSTYHKVEITPKWMRHYALDGDWQVSYGLPNEYFLGIAQYYTYLETERYGTVLQQPKIYLKSEFTMDTLIDQIANQGYMAIIHVVAGAFTSQEHYMVLADYEVIDGQGYFLVADPYVMPERTRTPTRCGTCRATTRAWSTPRRSCSTGTASPSSSLSRTATRFPCAARRLPRNASTNRRFYVHEKAALATGAYFRNLPAGWRSCGFRAAAGPAAALLPARGHRAAGGRFPV